MEEMIVLYRHIVKRPEESCASTPEAKQKACYFATEWTSTKKYCQDWPNDKLIKTEEYVIFNEERIKQ